MPQHKSLADLLDAAAWNRWRDENPDVEIDLAGIDLTRANLAGANLSGANLGGATLAKANLLGADLESATLRHARAVSADLIGADLRGAHLEGAKLAGSHLKEADLSGADFCGAHLEKADFRGAQMHWASLTQAYLVHGDLQKAILTGANFEGANLSGARLVSAYLVEANLTGSNLRRTKLIRASLEGADLTEADLSSANLSRVNFSNAITSQLVVSADEQDDDLYENLDVVNLPEMSNAILKIEGNGDVSVKDVAVALDAFYEVHKAASFVLQSKEVINWKRTMLGSTGLFELMEASDPQPLILTRVQINSPGIWELLGAYNPLKFVLDLLEHIHKVRKERRFEDLERDRFAIENDILRMDRTKKAVELLKAAGCSENETRDFVIQTLVKPALRIADKQEDGVFGNVQVTVVDALEKE